MNDPCKDCPTRKMLAKLCDFHVWGEDCFYVCEEYEAYKAALKAQEKDHQTLTVDDEK